MSIYNQYPPPRGSGGSGIWIAGIIVLIVVIVGAIAWSGRGWDWYGQNKGTAVNTTKPAPATTGEGTTPAPANKPAPATPAQ